jgi:hypothetical protein
MAGRGCHLQQLEHTTELALGEPRPCHASQRSQEQDPQRLDEPLQLAWVVAPSGQLQEQQVPFLGLRWAEEVS